MRRSFDTVSEAGGNHGEGFIDDEEELSVLLFSFRVLFRVFRVISYRENHEAHKKKHSGKLIQNSYH